MILNFDFIVFCKRYNFRKANFQLLYDCILHEDCDILYLTLNNAFEEYVPKYSIFIFFLYFLILISSLL